MKEKIIKLLSHKENSTNSEYKKSQIYLTLRKRIQEIREEKERNGYSKDEELIIKLKKSFPRQNIAKCTSGDRLATIYRLSDFIKSNLNK